MNHQPQQTHQHQQQQHQQRASFFQSAQNQINHMLQVISVTLQSSAPPQERRHVFNNRIRAPISVYLEDIEKAEDDLSRIKAIIRRDYARFKLKQKETRLQLEQQKKVEEEEEQARLSNPPPPTPELTSALTDQAGYSSAPAPAPSSAPIPDPSQPRDPSTLPLDVEMLFNEMAQPANPDSEDQIDLDDFDFELIQDDAESLLPGLESYANMANVPTSAINPPIITAAPLLPLAATTAASSSANFQQPNTANPTDNPTDQPLMFNENQLAASDGFNNLNDSDLNDLFNIDALAFPEDKEGYDPQDDDFLDFMNL